LAGCCRHIRANGAARGDLEARYRGSPDPSRRSGREFAYGEGAEKALIAAKDRGWTIVSVQQDAEKIF
jgi:hypothetical protein